MYQRRVLIFLTLVTLLATSLLTAACSSRENEIASTPVNERDEITYEQLMTAAPIKEGMVENLYFAPVGGALPARHALEGRLAVETDKLNLKLLVGSTAYFDYQFPGFSVDFFSEGDYLIPAQRDLQKDSPGRWELMFAPGKVWFEAGDQGMSRAAFPFVMVPYNRWFSYNGLATFLYDENTVSDFRFQIVQEATPPEAHFDAWAQLPMTYDPGPVPNRESLAAEYADEVAKRLPVKPWSALEGDVKPDALTGNLPEQEIAAAAVIIDGVLYQQPSMTRYGPFPYPQEMRHSVFSISKSMGGALALLHLAQKYGPEVLDLKIADYVEVTADHDGWDEVTFADALNMATGIGDAAPKARPLNIDAEEGDEKDNSFWLAEAAEEKLEVIFQYGNYPWGPGEIARYTDRNTFVLSAAMDSYLKSQEGPGADLWTMVTEEVLEPMGIYHLTMLHTREKDGGTGIPFMGVGAYPTIGEAARIAQLYQDGGVYAGQQLLHPELTRQALYRNGLSGLPTGKSFADGDQAYNLSFWGIAHRTDDGRYFQVPFMSGWGGNTIFLAQNGISSIVFTDYGNDSYSIDNPEFIEDLRPFPEDAVDVGFKPEFALVKE